MFTPILNADDLWVYIRGSFADLPLLLNIMNTDLDGLSCWEHKNGLQINTEKTQAI